MFYKKKFNIRDYGRIFQEGGENDTIYDFGEIPELTILATNNERVKEDAKDLLKTYSNNRFGIVDKDNNKLYFYKRSRTGKPILKAVEPIITGKTKGNTFTAPSSREYLAFPGVFDKGMLPPGVISKIRAYFDPDKKVASFGSYLNYLEKIQNKNTPAGRFEIMNYYNNKLDNPSDYKHFIQEVKSLLTDTDYVEEFRKGRMKSYGDGRMFTLKDVKDGKPQSFAIHTTGAIDRNALMDKGQGGAMSGGCINVNKNGTCAFDFLKKGSIISILPQKTDNPTDEKPYVKPDIPKIEKTDVEIILDEGKSAIKRIKNKFQDGGEIEEQKKWLQDYVNSPMYRQRLLQELGKNGKYDVDSEIKERSNNLLGLDYEITNRMPKNVLGLYGAKYPHDREVELDGYGILPDSYMNSKNRGKLKVRKKHVSDLTPLHEFSHAIDDGGSRIPDTTIRDIFDRVEGSHYVKSNNPTTNTNRRYSNVNRSFDLPSNTFDLGFDYISTPSELMARQNVLRYLLNKEGIYDAKKEVFDKEHFEKMLNNSNIIENNQVREYLDAVKGSNPDEFRNNVMWLMNNIAFNKKPYKKEYYKTPKSHA